VVLRARDAQKLAQAKRAVEDMLERAAEHNQIATKPRPHSETFTSEKGDYGDLPSHTARRLNVNTIIAERPATNSIH
jgi:hypothetical protein